VGLGPFAHVRLVRTFHLSTSFLALNRGQGCPVATGGPTAGIRAFPYIVGAIQPPLSSTAGRRVVWVRCTVPSTASGSSATEWLGPLPRLPRRITQGNQLQQHPGPGSAERVRTRIGARPQLWKVLWTEPTVQGRRPT
jgi:hypothetical protein